MEVIIIYKAIDLFAGIGGIRLGFQNAFQNDIQFVFANEIDKDACKTYQANFHKNPQGDIRTLDIKNIPEFDILLAGFPCQSFSVAGQRMGFHDERGNLFMYLAKILDARKPKAFLFENVKNLVKHDGGKTFEIIKSTLENTLNYTIYHKILNAKNYGVAQNRERIFIVGFNEPKEFTFPESTNTTMKLKNILEENVPSSFHISQQYLNSLRAREQRHIQKGNGFRYTPLDINSIANTLVCGGMGHETNLIKTNITENCWSEGKSLKLPNNEGLRFMTVREWARLQGFPDTYIFPVKKTKTYKMIANSVAIPVIAEIAMQIKKNL